MRAALYAGGEEGAATAATPPPHELPPAAIENASTPEPPAPSPDFVNRCSIH
jgi:hypothetical protein